MTQQIDATEAAKFVVESESALNPASFVARQYLALRAEFLALSEKCERMEKVVEAARDMGQRLQSLPWYRSDSGNDAPYCLSFNSWKNWNYGECQKLFDALDALEPGEADG